MSSIGTDTTSGSTEAILLTTFFFPDAWKKARAQVDAVVGRDRLPSFKDMEDLPYIQAVRTLLLAV